MSSGKWTVVLGIEAQRDLTSILEWTAQEFSTQQAERYADLILDALDEIALAPNSAPGKERPEIGPGYKTWRLSRPGRHFILYRQEDGEQILIVRILHDSMELSRHLPRPGRD